MPILSSRRITPHIPPGVVAEIRRLREQLTEAEVENVRLEAENAELRDLVHQRLTAAGEPFWQATVGPRLDPPRNASPAGKAAFQVTTVIDRTKVVSQIADHLADRDSYIIVAPPDAIFGLVEQLANVPNWSGYVDQGINLVLHTTGTPALAFIALMGVPATVVIAVPKTVPADVLRKAFGQPIPADGSRDIVILHGKDDQPMIWPLLFVDALTKVDPKAAAEIYANDLSRAN